MPIIEEEVYFDDDDLEDERRDRTESLLHKLASLPSHIGWFDIDLFREIATEYIVCQITVRELDKQIINDPITYSSLDRIRNNTVQRMNKLRADLGLTAAKINQFAPKKAEKPVNLAALADEDYVE